MAMPVTAAAAATQKDRFFQGMAASLMGMKPPLVEYLVVVSGNRGHTRGRCTTVRETAIGRGTVAYTTMRYGAVCETMWQQEATKIVGQTAQDRPRGELGTVPCGIAKYGSGAT